MSDFKDHFAPVSDAYGRHRPGYPPELFDWLAGLAPHRRLAWDCATGTGQAAGELSRHFDEVRATDASARQIDTAEPRPGVTFAVAPAEASGLPDHSAALVTVAQALHWFNTDAFYAEVCRVLSSGGVIAVWSYGLLETGDARIDAALLSFHDADMGPYWPPERRHVVNGYRDLAFPFQQLDTPEFAMQCHWNLEQLTGYLGTWSAVARCRDATGEDPVERLRSRLDPIWGDLARVRQVRWPLALRVGRVPSAAAHA
ncbi:SAM-dependent methyltransferase [Thioalkalivibrio denitrificans]|uniref:SAM-dependent methyltransferase n=1 Tax=Thioalkalivibrio denitrificans TaxID=108003 RepID=A0A1V3NSM1_9GAMM|nr:class I SAM-dependent methyltransferase [Thioalkalivibrio denitrificans]OOG28087.1 SAM-dependent methyltransferase [Thioalkalivibrio denitrificans]